MARNRRGDQFDPAAIFDATAVGLAAPEERAKTLTALAGGQKHQPKGRERPTGPLVMGFPPFCAGMRDRTQIGWAHKAARMSTLRRFGSGLARTGPSGFTLCPFHRPTIIDEI